MRLFVALPICDEVRENLAALVGELRRADSKPRWVNPANLHITLKFIGHVPKGKVSSIENALADIKVSEPLNLEFRGIGFFPNERRPAVIWLGVGAPPNLAALAGQIDEGLGSCGVPRETRPFAAHLTLARFKEGRLSEALRLQIGKCNDQSFGKQSSDEFQLMESKLKSAGAEYTTVRSFRFAPPGLAR